MKLRSVASAAAVSLSAGLRALQVEAQAPGEVCAPESSVVFPPHFTDRLVPPGKPVFEVECETDDAPLGLAPPPALPPSPLSLPIVDSSGGATTLEADASGGDNTMDFAS